MTVTISSLLDNTVDRFGGTAINNEGVVVGFLNNFAGVYQNGTVSNLTGVDYANAINNSGQIVGQNFNGSWNAVIWQNGVLQTLPTLKGATTTYSAAFGINDSGLVVGVSAAPGEEQEAVLWQNGVATDLGTLPGGSTTTLNESNSYAAAINAYGQIVGASLTTGQVYHAVMWQSGKITDLGVFAAGDQSFATAINITGEVVGFDEPASYESSAVLWKNGKMTNLGTLPGDNYSIANAINASGIIVGDAGIYANPSGNHAVMWQNGQIYDLNNLISPMSGWYLSSADAINDNGEIVGQGTLVDAHGNITYWGTYDLIITGNAAVVGVTVQTALQATLTTPVAVVDSAANVLANLNALAALWQTGTVEQGLLTSITLSDQTTPAWTLTAAQFDSGAGALAALNSPVSLTVTGAVGVNQVAEVLFAPIQLTSALTVSDTGQNIGAALDDLSTGVAAGKIGSITISAGSVIDLYSDQVTTDQAALKAVTNQYFSLLVTPSSATATIDGAGYGTTVMLSGDAALYKLTSEGNGTGFFLSGNGVNDTLNNVTMLQFADKTVTVAANNSFDEYTALLYQGALGRTPDPSGLQHWEALANALPAAEQATGIYALSNYSGNYSGTLSIAAGFTNSAEFVADYGSLTNAQFVTQLYFNILDRAADSGGYASWINALTPVSQGGLGESREYVLVGFAESAEAISNATKGFTGQSGAHAAWLMLF